jgi:hypothetical protein
MTVVTTRTIFLLWKVYKIENIIICSIISQKGGKYNGKRRIPGRIPRYGKYESTHEAG